jgi:signal transduction histidine kinase/CheY-like chemotaxis protein
MNPDVVLGLESAAWPALSVDAGGVILNCNAAGRTLFGPVVAALPVGLNTIWASANGTPPANFLAWWEKNHPPIFDLQFRLPDGVERKFSTAVALLPTGGGSRFLFQLLPLGDHLAERTAESPTEFRTVTSDAAVKQRLECALQLARTVSLDFNNALTGVLAHTSLLLGKAEPNHPWRRSLLEVEKSAARAAEIAAELALFSRQEKEVRRSPAGNLNAVVHRCLEAFRSSTGPRLTWRFTQERGLYEARYDEAKVQQALTKVFENAVEAYAAGAAGQISVATRNVELTQSTQDRNVRLTAGSYVCVEVTDNGAGIEDTVLPRVFEPFFTTKRPPHRGLGLALVYGIVTNHGGGVALSSQVGKGASVRVYLPAEKTVVSDGLEGDKEFHGTGTILVVDDESLMLTMAEAILSEFGYRVLTASSGHKALAMLAQPTPAIDLLITDLVMPGMGGRELMERLRRDGSHLPIVAMSGYVLPEEKLEHATYLQKPFTSSDLLRKVKAALARPQQ